ncbi:MAG: hypothetical protein MRY83_09405, partial [Flavobacteriales bacterium]|nr:hypothetical protein [Flavobacteriales bacterium]
DNAYDPSKIFFIDNNAADQAKAAGVMLMVIDATDISWTSEKFGLKNLKDLQRSVPGFELLSSGLKRDATLNYKEYYEIEYIQVTGKGNRVRHQQRYIMKNDLGFVLAISALDNNFNNVIGEGSSIMNSFVIKPTFRL